jgi:hypothetical protein
LNFLERFFGANWRTSLSGWLTILAGAIYVQPQIVSFLPDRWQPTVVGLAGLVTIGSGGTFAHLVKDRSISGNGSADDPTRVLDKQTDSSRLIEPGQ